MALDNQLGTGLDKLESRPTKTGEARELIRQAILSGRLAPDSRHSVGRLAESLGVSRTPVREALIELAASGMVRFEPNRGVRIMRTTIPEIREIFEIRLLLEVPTVETATARASDEQLEILRARLGDMVTAAERDKENELWVSDRLFHYELLSIAGNQRLADYVDSLRDMVLTQGLATAGRSRTLHDIVAEHRRVFDLVEAGDGGAAAEAMDQHLRHTSELLIAQEMPAESSS